MEQSCSVCGFPLSSQFTYCPKCGKKLQRDVPSSSFVAQFGIYLISFFLPPFGLWPAFRYLRQKEQRLKLIGIVAVMLTFLSILLSVVIVEKLLSPVTSSLNEEIQLYQSL